MLIEEQVRQYLALNEWFQSPLGLFIANEFQEQLMPVTDYLKGEHILQLGSCGPNPWLDILQFNRKWVAAPYTLTQSVHLESSLAQLPFPKNSLDAVIAPLSLEPFGTSLSLIDEMDRVLKPMGYLILLCFNPWSLWGAALKGGMLGCYHDRAVHMRSPFYMNRIFMQRGYRQCVLSHFCYLPPINNQSLIKKFVFFDEVGKMLWPFPSGFYCYIAQKYELRAPSLMPLTDRMSTKAYDASMRPAIKTF